MTSVVIPTSNEAQHLSATLEAIAAAGVDVCHEVVVVDAGSNDPTPTIASAHGARVVPSARRQRAAQMNLGAEQARGDILLFLHGDTLLPAQALEKIERVMQGRRVVGGAFASLRFAFVTAAGDVRVGRSSGAPLRLVFGRSGYFRSSRAVSKDGRFPRFRFVRGPRFFPPPAARRPSSDASAVRNFVRAPLSTLGAMAHHLGGFRSDLLLPVGSGT